MRPNNLSVFTGEEYAVSKQHSIGKEDTYSRIDYILLSRAMARRWDKKETYVLTLPNWGAGSDHRPIVAGFSLGDAK